MSEEIVRLIRESLSPDLDPVEVSSRLDAAYELFLQSDRQKVALPKTETEQVLRFIAYGHVSDRKSLGAFHSGADSIHSNPRLKRFEDRFAHIVEITGINADWRQYLDAANTEYNSKQRGPDRPRTQTIRSGRYGAPRKE